MSSKKILAASLAAMLAVSSVSAMAFAEDAANDDYTYTWTIGKYTREVTDSAELKVVTPESSPIMTASNGSLIIKDATEQAPSEKNENATNKFKIGIWEAFQNFNITELKSGKVAVEAWGTVQAWEEPYVLEIVQSNGKYFYDYVPFSQSAIGKNTGYTPLVPVLKGGKHLVLNNSNLDKADGTVADPSVTTWAAGAVCDAVVKAFDTTVVGDYFEVSELEAIFDAADTAQAGLDAFFVWDGTTKPTDKYDLAGDGNVINGTNAQAPGMAAVVPAGAYDATNPATFNPYIKTTDGFGGLKSLTSADFAQATFDGSTRYGSTPVFEGGDWVANPKTTVDLSKAWNTSAANGASALAQGFYPGTNNLHAGLNTAPVEATLTIPTDRTHTLIKYAGVKFGVDIDMVVDGETYDNFVVGNWSIGNAEVWGWVDDHFSSSGAANFQKPTAWDASGNPTSWGAGLALVAENSENNSKYLASAIKANLSVEPDVKTTDEDLYLTRKGTLLVDFGTSVSPEFMKNFNNGGTITFNLSADASPLNYMTGYVLYWNANKRVPLEGANAGYVVSGKSITFTAPAGLSYDAGTVNTWKAFNIQWVLEPNDYAHTDDLLGGSNIIVDGNGAHATPTLPDVPELRIESITFKANSTAPADEGNNNNSGSNSGSNGGGSTTNPGSTGNPNTGIALAVAPVVLAAGAVATVVAKKRK